MTVDTTYQTRNTGMLTASLLICTPFRLRSVASKQQTQSRYTSPFGDDSLPSLPQPKRVTITELKIDRMGNLLVMTQNPTTSDGIVGTEHSDDDDDTGEYHFLHN